MRRRVLAQRRASEHWISSARACGQSILLLLLVGCAAQPIKLPPTPSDLYGELFVDVQTQSVFADSKTFVDALPKRSPREILDAYRRENSAPSFDLRDFVAREFTTTAPHDIAYQT